MKKEGGEESKERRKKGRLWQIFMRQMWCVPTRVLEAARPSVDEEGM